MNIHDATETAYKNGYKVGYEAGKRDAVKKGRWIFGESMGHGWMKCNLCLVSQTPTGVFSFCPNCGADMRQA